MLATPAPTSDTPPTDALTTDVLTTDVLTTGGDDDLETPCTTGVALPCWTADPELWFAESPAVVEQAKALCAPCPLREACLAGALERREPWGVWGGQLLVAGVVVPYKRPRGRPRKHPLPALSGAA